MLKFVNFLYVYLRSFHRLIYLRILFHPFSEGLVQADLFDGDFRIPISSKTLAVFEEGIGSSLKKDHANIYTSGCGSLHQGRLSTCCRSINIKRLPRFRAAIRLWHAHFKEILDRRYVPRDGSQMQWTPLELIPVVKLGLL